MNMITGFKATGRTLFTAWLLAVFAATASAEMKPFELNMDRVEINGAKGLAFSETYFIPTVNLIVTASGSVWAQSKGGGSNAQAHGKYVVKGLDKAVMQNLARTVQDDLVSKMRAAGYTVLTYDDMKTEPDVAAQELNKPDEDWGLPMKSANGLEYVVASPTDAQAFNFPITGPAFWLRHVAKDKKLVVLVPELTFTVPIMYGTTEAGYKRDSASINVVPKMRLSAGMLWSIDGKGRAPNIIIQEHGARFAAEEAGKITKVSENDTEFSKAWKRVSAGYVMDLDPVAFNDGILRVAYAVNDLIVAQVKKAH